MEQVRLAELVASKLCHDMIGPMTAMVHGVELLRQTEIGDPEAFSLLSNGIEKAHAKLNFYRCALGGALGSEGRSALEAARAAAETLYQTLKPQLVWRAPDIALPRPILRVALNLLLLANDCLARGGAVTIEPGEDCVAIIATGDRARLRPDIAEGLAGRFVEDGVMSLNVLPMLTAIMARQAGVEIVIEDAPQRIAFVLKGPPFLGLAAKS